MDDKLLMLVVECTNIKTGLTYLRQIFLIEKLRIVLPKKTQKEFFFFFFIGWEFNTKFGSFLQNKIRVGLNISELD